MLKPNITEQNAFIRIISGVMMACFGTARLARNPKCTTGTMMVAAGAMKIGEGYYRYCPLTAMAKEQSSQAQSAQGQSAQS